MNKEFLVSVKSPGEYDFINGRVRVLETQLFDQEQLKRFSKLTYEEFLKELEGSPYRQSIKSTDPSDVLAGITRHYNEMLSELEKYTSKGFINVFARSKEIFLKIKKLAYADEGKVDEESLPLYKFLTSDNGDYPVILRECFEDLIKNKEHPFIISTIVDTYHILFLNEFANNSKSSFIRYYYKKYAENYVDVLLNRAYGLAQKGAISKEDFNAILHKITYKFASLVVNLKEIKNVDDFVELAKERKQLYGAKDDEGDFLEIYVTKELLAVIDEGKFIIEGIEPVFVYMERLRFEVDTLTHVLYSNFNKKISHST